MKETPQKNAATEDDKSEIYSDNWSVKNLIERIFHKLMNILRKREKKEMSEEVLSDVDLKEAPEILSDAEILSLLSQKKYKQREEALFEKWRKEEEQQN